MKAVSPKVSDRAAKIGSVGTANGRRVKARHDSASPGTSTPSQNDRVPSKTARSAFLKFSINWRRDDPSPCSYTKISACVNDGVMPLDVAFNDAYDVNSTIVRPCIAVVNAMSPLSNACWKPG